MNKTWNKQLYFLLNEFVDQMKIYNHYYYVVFCDYLFIILLHVIGVYNLNRFK